MRTVNWISDTEDKFEFDVVQFDHLFTKPVLEKDDNFLDFLTSRKKPTAIYTKYIGEPCLRHVRANSVFQIERIGNMRCDSDCSTSKGFVGYLIPDGKQASQSVAAESSEVVERVR